LLIKLFNISTGFSGHLVVVFDPDFPRNTSNYFPFGSSQFGEDAISALEPANAQILQAQRQHGQDPQLRLQVQQGRLVRPLPTLEESQSTVFHGLLGKQSFSFRQPPIIVTLRPT